MRIRWVADIAQIALAWQLIIVLMTVFLGSGLAWTMLGPRLSTDPAYAFQTDLLNLATGPAVRVVVLGDDLFVETVSSALQSVGIDHAAVGAPRVQLSDLLAPLGGLHKSPAEVILLQNSPHLWTDVNYRFRQKLTLWSFLRKAKPFYSSDSQSVFWAVVKDWAGSARADNYVPRPVSLQNASPKFPPRTSKRQGERVQKMQEKPGPTLVWVTDNRLLATDASTELVEAFDDRFSSPDLPTRFIKYVTLRDVVSLVEALLGL